MRRRHRRPCIWSLAGWDSFCKLWRVSVGAVVHLYGPWEFLDGSCRFLAESWQDSTMCVALLPNTRLECKKRCQESLQIIQNEAWKRLQISKNDTSGRFGDVLGALGFRSTERRPRQTYNEDILAPLGRFCVPFWIACYCGSF